MQLLETSTPSTLQTVIIFLTVLSCAVVALRFYTRSLLNQSVKIDDWSALLALFFVLVLAIYMIIGISYTGFFDDTIGNNVLGITYHYVGYPVPNDFTGEEHHPLVSGSLQHFYFWHVLLFPALWFIKCSFVLFYRRVLVADTKDYKDWANILVISCLALISIWSLSFGLAWIFSCNPIRGFWSFPYGDGNGPCINTWQLNSAISISDFLVDLVILLIPVPLIWRLHLPTSRKLAVLIVFFLGILAVVASIMRMVRILWVASDENAEVDGLLLNTTMLFWGMIEANLGLLAACLPTLRGLFKSRAIDSFFKSYRSMTWLKSIDKSKKSTQKSKKSTEGQTSIPLTMSPTYSAHKSFSECRDKHGPTERRDKAVIPEFKLRN